jgi:hypothetical protein
MSKEVRQPLRLEKNKNMDFRGGQASYERAYWLFPDVSAFNKSSTDMLAMAEALSLMA